MNVITINPVDGSEREITGKVRGHWIAYKDDRFRNTYTVLHIPSGYFALNYIRLQRDAVELAERFAALPIDASSHPMPAGHMDALIGAIVAWKGERGEYRG